MEINAINGQEFDFETRRESQCQSSLHQRVERTFLNSSHGRHMSMAPRAGAGSVGFEVSIDFDPTTGGRDITVGAGVRNSRGRGVDVNYSRSATGHTSWRASGHPGESTPSSHRSRHRHRHEPVHQDVPAHTTPAQTARRHRHRHEPAHPDAPANTTTPQITWHSNISPYYRALFEAEMRNQRR